MSSAEPDPQAVLMGRQARALRESFERIMQTRQLFSPSREQAGTQTEPIFFRSSRASFLNDTSDLLDVLSDSLDRLETTWRDEAASDDDGVTQAATEGSVTPLKERSGIRDQVEEMMRALQLVRSDLLKLLDPSHNPEEEEVSHQAQAPVPALRPIDENEPLHQADIGVKDTPDYDDALLDISCSANASDSRARENEDGRGGALQEVNESATGAACVEDEEVEESVPQDSLDETLGVVAKWLVKEVRCDLEEELADKDPVSFDFRALD